MEDSDQDTLIPPMPDNNSDVQFSDRHYGAIYPSVLFDQEMVDRINWKELFGF